MPKILVILRDRPPAMWHFQEVSRMTHIRVPIDPHPSEHFEVDDAPLNPNQMMFQDRRIFLVDITPVDGFGRWQICAYVEEELIANMRRTR